MPEFRPFRGVRYDTVDLETVIAPPYDVIDPDQRDTLARRSEHNSVHLILPEPDAAGDQYEHAARLVAEWSAARVLVRDDAPTFYAYRMTYSDDRNTPRHTVGILGGLVLPSAAGEGDVLPHERTLPKAKSDRLALLRATRMNLDPIWGVTPSRGLAEVAERALPLAKTVDDDGVTHELAAVAEADIASVVAIVADAPVVLADGHHRFETAITYRNERRAAGASVPGDDAVMCLMVELAEEQLWVQPIHRVIRAAVSPTRLRLDLARDFEIVDAAANTPETVDRLMRALEHRGGVGLVDGEGIARLVPDPGALAGARAELEPVLAEVASAWFEVIAAEALASHDVTYRHDARAVAALVADGTAGAAILLPPVTVEQIRAAARARVRMPQKTTFFAPKPRTGLVFRGLDED